MKCTIFKTLSALLFAGAGMLLAQPASDTVTNTYK
jgi:hypothetical protein